MASHHDSKGGKKGESIVALVLADHVKVKGIYKDIQGLPTDDESAEQLYQTMCWEIALHAVAEELILYPLQESLDKEGKALAQESREDHEKTKEALRELDGKSLKEKGVREKVDVMMEDLIEHMNKEEEGDLIKLKSELPEEKLVTAGKDFQQVKLLVPDVASSNQAHSDNQADKSEQDSHFKTPMSLLLASTEKLQGILGTHGKGESVSVNKEHHQSGGKSGGDDKSHDSKGHSGEKGKSASGNDGHSNSSSNNNKNNNNSGNSSSNNSGNQGGAHSKEGAHSKDAHSKEGTHSGSSHSKEGAHSGSAHSKEGAHSGSAHSKEGAHSGGAHSKDTTEGSEIPYNLRHRDEKGHVVPDEVEETAAHNLRHRDEKGHVTAEEKNGGQNKSGHSSDGQKDVEMASQESNGGGKSGHHSNGGDHANGHKKGQSQGQGGQGGEDAGGDGGKGHHGKRGNEDGSDTGSRKKVADSRGGHGEMEVDGDNN